MSKLYKVTEIADLLGIHPNTVYRLMSEKRIGSVQIGKRSVRIPQDALDHFLASRMRASEDEAGVAMEMESGA